MDDRLYALDRIEDGHWAVLSGDGLARELLIPVEWLPEEAREGDLIRASRLHDGGVGLEVEREATEARLDEMRRLRRSIRRGEDGDISL